MFLYADLPNPVLQALFVRYEDMKADPVQQLSWAQ